MYFKTNFRAKSWSTNPAPDWLEKIPGCLQPSSEKCLFSMTYITISKGGKLPVFRCISLSANPHPHFKTQLSQAALFFKFEHQLQVEKHCPSRTFVNQIVVLVFFPTSKFTASAWHHTSVEQLSWFWGLLQDFPLTGREDAEFALMDSKQQQEATRKHFFHSEDGQT